MGPSTFKQKNTSDYKPFLTFEEALRGALATWREKGRELATTSLELGLNSTSDSPVVPGRWRFQISATQREAETSVNVNEH